MTCYEQKQHLDKVKVLIHITFKITNHIVADVNCQAVR